MLVARKMGSHGGLPFGYDPNGIQGIGLPNFSIPGPPPGRPLLNERENEEMDQFFTTFDEQEMFHHAENAGQYNWMPPTFVGSETSLRQDFQQQYQFNGMSYAPYYDQNFGWQYPQPMTRPDMRFGSDPNFQHSGYTAPSGPVEADMSFFNAFESHSTAPNTVPSSPTATKKRKIDDVERDTRNGRPQHRKRPSTAKTEPITPLSKPQTPQETEDAEYDEEHSPSPSIPQREKPRARKKSTTETPKKKKDSSGEVTPIARVPLTAAQKKANHTNSEQRRRDATARAYAELYDMVPEIAEMGKQSTMKRLEVVVDKVRTVKGQLERLRSRLNVDPTTGMPIVANMHGITSSDLADPRMWQ